MYDFVYDEPDKLLVAFLVCYKRTLAADDSVPQVPSPQLQSCKMPLYAAYHQGL